MEVGKTGEAFILETNGDLVASSVGAGTMLVEEVQDTDGPRTEVVRQPAVESQDPLDCHGDRRADGSAGRVGGHRPGS